MIRTLEGRAALECGKGDSVSTLYIWIERQSESVDADVEHLLAFSEQPMMNSEG
jgi:hypothetical protein